MEMSAVYLEPLRASQVSSVAQPYDTLCSLKLLGVGIFIFGAVSHKSMALAVGSMAESPSSWDVH